MDDIQELVEWVALIIRQNTTPYVSLRDGKTIIAEEVARTILSHPSLLIEVDAKLPEIHPSWTEWDAAVINTAQQDMFQAGYKPVIPLAEALKEVGK